MEQLTFVVAFLAALGTAILAGNFFAFSAYLMTAIRGLSPERGIVAMQAITKAIKKRPFVIVFFGTDALCAVLVVLALFQWGQPQSAYWLTGSLLFLLGSFLVTMVRHVPLNAKIAAVSPDSIDGIILWKSVPAAWSAWNHVRTVTTLLACAFLIMGLVEGGNPFGAN